MRLFECPNCGQRIYFENTRCENCDHATGYIPERAVMTALALAGDAAGTAGAVAAGQAGAVLQSLDPQGDLYRFCQNAAYDVCNWLVPADGPDAFCGACRLNRTIPDLGDPQNVVLWRVLERAKHRLVYSLLSLGLPLTDRFRDPAQGLAFDFLTSPQNGWGDIVLTGHASGVITINLDEADDAARERKRSDMAEPYRTVLGHFRHESGHYYWDRLVRGGVWHEAFRTLFGDERADYGQALQNHYANGPPDDWRETYVSAYAAAHPWEDFAECWAHYLHMVDTIETAAAFGLRLDAAPEPKSGPAEAEPVDVAGPDVLDFDSLVATWFSLTHVLNSLNVSMGQPEPYPFVLTPTVLGKMRFIHGLIHPMKPRGNR